MFEVSVARATMSVIVLSINYMSDLLQTNVKQGRESTLISKVPSCDVYEEEMESWDIAGMDRKISYVFQNEGSKFRTSICTGAGDPST